jgi:hypothetical protein
MHYAFDWEFWCRLIAHGVTPSLLDDAVAVFRLHEESKTCTRWDRFCAELEPLIVAYLPQLDAGEKRAAGLQRTNLVCTRLRHEANRDFSNGQGLALARNLIRSVARRPHLLAKRTPYQLLLECLVPQLRKSSSGT